MPQGRRKVPFSGKKKKEQLKIKRQNKNDGNLHNPECSGETSSTMPQLHLLNKQPELKSGRNVNRYAIAVQRETEEERRQKLEEINDPIELLPETELEISYEDFFQEEISIPTRPPWDYSLSKEELDARETKYFQEFCQDLEARFGPRLGFYELNLETWRQLWRVAEMSDILLQVVDVRSPVQGFCPALYHQLTASGRHVVLVLNKCDLVPADLVVAWREYLRASFPRLHVLPLAAFPTKFRRKKDKPAKMSAQSVLDIYDICEQLVNGAVDLSSWKAKIEEDIKSEEEQEDGPCEVLGVVESPPYLGPLPSEMYSNKILTIGCVGIPNVGKSSLINGLKGKKVVSVSRTPGHTKHFQTIHLSPTVRLCDCPGLVFPSLCPRPLQVLLGSYPIAQVRIPRHPVCYLARRVDLPRLLQLRLQEDDSYWSASAICRAWAAKRDYRTARASRLDENRAANDILRKALDGRTICLAFYPPGYVQDREKWRSHPDVPKIQAMQSTNGRVPGAEHYTYYYSSDEDPPELPVASNKFSCLEEET